MTTDHEREYSYLQADLRDLRDWLPSPEAVRDRVMQRLVVGVGLQDGEAHPALPTDREVETIATASIDAISAGRFIDFGFWPQDMIKLCGDRGGPLYNQGALPMPFSEPWMFMHTWQEEAPHRTCAIYVVHPALEAEIVQLDPLILGQARVLCVSDRAVLLEPVDSVSRYHCNAAPSPFRLMLGLDDIESVKAAASNVLDPLMTALMLLNTRGVVRETVPAPAKLNKHRIAKGQYPIPSYERVASQEYATAILVRRDPRHRSGDQGGHHASPIAHIRRGHFRNYQSGQRTFIKDTLVNVSLEAREAFQSQRTHYTVKL